MNKQPSLSGDPLSLRNLILYTVAGGILLLVASFIFGFYVLAIALVAYLSALVVEWGFAHFRKRPFDRGWMVTPMIFALCLPPTLPLWMVVVGSVFGVFFGKAIFGGLGKNVFNPAIVGVLFLMFAFPSYMLTNWLDPITNDVVASATPLITLNRGIAFPYTLTQLLLGNVAGTLGETFRLGIIILGALLIVLKVTDWRIPVFYIATVFLLNAAGVALSFDQFKDPFLSIFVGGLMLGAFFIATDPFTAPKYPTSKIIYGIGLGFITVIIRNFASFPEGVVFAIIIMNAISPLIDTLKINRRFVEEKQ